MKLKLLIELFCTSPYKGFSNPIPCHLCAQKGPEMRLMGMIYILELMYYFWKYSIYNFKVSLGRNSNLTTILILCIKLCIFFLLLSHLIWEKEHSGIIQYNKPSSPGPNLLSSNLNTIFSRQVVLYELLSSQMPLSSCLI